MNLYSLTTKLLKAEKTMLKYEYGFDEIFNIFDEIENNRNKPNDYKPRQFNMTNTKNKILEY